MEPLALSVVLGAEIALFAGIWARRGRVRSRRWTRGLDWPHAGAATQGTSVVLLLQRLLPASSETDLDLAGLAMRGGAGFILRLQVGLGLLGFLMPSVLGLAVSRMPPLALPAAGLLLGVLAPRLWVDHLVARRRRLIAQDLPGVVDLLAACSVAGLNLTQSLQMAAARQEGALGDELRTAVRLMQAGRTAASAVRSMALRVNIPDLTALANAVVLTESLGTPVADLFRSQAAMAREQQRRRVEAAIGRLPIKFTAISTVLILPSLFILTVLPSLLTFLSTPW